MEAEINKQEKTNEPVVLPLASLRRSRTEKEITLQVIGEPERRRGSESEGDEGQRSASSVSSSSSSKTSSTSSPKVERNKETLPPPVSPVHCSRQKNRNLSLAQRCAVSMAAAPCTYFMVSLLIALALSVVGLVVGNFSQAVEVNNYGWVSRGTLIGNRQTQLMLIQLNQDKLWLDPDGSAWGNLLRNVQPGWEMQGVKLIGDDELPDRRLEDRSSTAAVSSPATMETNHDYQQLPFEWTPQLGRSLQEAGSTPGSIVEGCDMSWYNSSSMVQDTHLWPVWRLKAPQTASSLLNATHIRDICVTEEETQTKLIQQGLCFGCENTSTTPRCLPPYSLVFYTRLVIPNGFMLDCDGLAEAWGTYFTAKTLEELAQCVEDMESLYDPSLDTALPDSCPFGFGSSLVDQFFDDTHVIRYSSSIFASVDDVDELFENVNGFSRGVGGIEGAYDTQYEDFVMTIVNNSVVYDMSLAIGSAVISFIAINVHTRSPFLSLIGLLQIALSFPLAYFAYTFLGQLVFFPFMNFIGVFVVFALGADDVFVAVDKWKNARLKLGDVDTTVIAAEALPDAAGALFLTSLTTAVAFFATALCPVAPIRCFAIFCGLLIVFDYIMCVLLIFPALSIYDGARDRKNRFIRYYCCAKATEAETLENSQQVGVEQKPSLIRRILSSYYVFLHRLRWGLLIVSLVAFVLSAVYASRIALPKSSDVRLINPDKYQYETRYEWSLNLLSTALLKKGGSAAYIMFGTKPADTGDHNDPESWSQLVLDGSFAPSGKESQVYWRDFCQNLFATEWAEPIEVDYVCPINAFETWLKEQANSTKPDQGYSKYCGGASGLPMSQELFDSCIYIWGQQIGETHVLAREGKVKVVYVPFKSRVRYDSPFSELEREWRVIEKWTNDMNLQAPAGFARGFVSSVDFWYYDTNDQMLSAAYTAAAIAIATGAVVILFSSRSLILTLFSGVTIAFVLFSVVAILVALGWTLGFLESICFVILIGVSADFVIHFSHAYAMLPGNVGRGQRTKHALIQMGPSILAAAFTTIAAAIIMLFTVIAFFVKFAVVLFLTILMATCGSFIMFLTMTDCIGPAEPTFMMDLLRQKFLSCCHRHNRVQDDTSMDTEVETQRAAQDSTSQPSSSGSTFKFEV